MVSFYVTMTYDYKAAEKQLVKDCPHFLPLAISYQFLYIHDLVQVRTLLFALLFFATFIVSTFASLLLFCLIQFMGKTQHFSKATKKMYIRLLINLSCTILIPVVLHAVPTVVLESLMLFQLQASLWISTAMWSIGSSHALINCVAFIGLNEFYLKKFKTDIRFCLNPIVTKVAPSSQALTGISLINEQLERCSNRNLNNKDLGCSSLVSVKDDTNYGTFASKPVIGIVEIRFDSLHEKELPQQWVHLQPERK
ncbi:unnamed protein product [Auanema sp. JU1783]|nr:unnamed protein product [Auanema sp. JU1783]